jgi:hypothetical protein
MAPDGNREGKRTHTIEYDAVDLYAGSGRWGLAAERLGLKVIGIEWVVVPAVAAVSWGV